MSKNIFEQSVFAKHERKVWPHQFRATLLVHNIHGGTPDDPRIAEGWLRSKFAEDSDELIRDKVAEIMVDAKVGLDEALQTAVKAISVNRFKRDDEGLYVEGRQVKAMLKEGASIAAQGGSIPGGQKYGVLATKKGLLGFVAEHVQVEEDRVHLGVGEADEVMQKIVHARGNTGIAYEEVVYESKLTFHVSTDFDLAKVDKDWWPKVWVTAQKIGIGASRSQSAGRFAVTEWEVV